jgi:exopolysaccharide biosynthesis polyprenyl glycosylphosphotransferase
MRLGGRVVGFADAAPILAALFLIFLIARSGGLRIAGAPTILPRERYEAAPVMRRDIGSERIDLNQLAPADISGYSNKARREERRFGKRALDVAAALTLLILASPLIIAVAIIIKLDSPGPVLYRQRRIGFGGREFDMLKFRSMVVDAEKNGPQWAAKNDCRVTRIGRLIRKTRFDEIPQAINILSGDMSFVGPRPERPEFVKVLETEIPNYHLRHIVRPGLTGWAQVKYVYGASVEDARIKLQYDLHYIKHFTLWLDCSIMLMTVRVALFGVGSR